MQSFEIPEAPQIGPLRREPMPGTADQHVLAGAARFTVNNRNPHEIVGRASVLPQGNAKAEWFTLEGEAQRQFKPASGSDVYTVRIKVPPGTGPGPCGLKLRMVNVNDTDNDFTESASLGFDIPAGGEIVNPWPWWKIALIVLGALVVLGGVGAGVWVLMHRDLELPDYTGGSHLCDDTLKTLEEKGVHAECRAAGVSSNLPMNTIVEQQPEAGTRIKKGETVVLFYDPGLPDLFGRHIDDATRVLTERNATVSLREISGDAAAPIVAARAQAEGDPGRSVELNRVVEQKVISTQPLTVELALVRGVSVPRVSGTLGGVSSRLRGLGLDIGTITTRFNASATVNTVIDQGTPVGEVVEKGTPIDLVIATRVRCSSIFCRRVVTQIEGHRVLIEQ